MGNVFFSGAGTGVVSVLSGIPTSICTDLTETRNGLNVTLKWNDPDDTIIDGNVLATWGRTVIVRKKGGYPQHESDGTVLFTNTVRGAYSVIGFQDEIPDTEDKYYYRAFPISVNGVVNLDPLNCFGVEMYSFIIDPAESNPANAVTYLGTNVSYTPAYMDFGGGEFNYGSWENAFFMDKFKPCMLGFDGEVDYYLDPDDYSKQADGETDSDIADSTYEGNVMVEIGQIWVSDKVYNGKHFVRIANGKISDDFDCITHTKKDGTLAQYIYRSAYDGSLVDGKIRSISGLAPCVNQTGTNQISYAKANGTGWNIDEYAVRRLINYLLILLGKSLNTQAVFGKGRNSGGNNNNPPSSWNQLDSGTLNDKGMFYGDNSNGGVKVFGIENWWANVWKLTNGLICNKGKMKYKMCEGQWDGSTTDDYNTNGNGYIDSGVTLSGTSGSCIKTMTLVPGVGLVPTNISGSDSTYYADGCWFNLGLVDGFARFGGASARGLLCGAFSCTVANAVGLSSWSFGVALSYKSAS